MEQLFTPQFFTQYGLSAIFIYWSWKLYNDMREDSKTREEKLMEHLDKITDTNDEIKKTMQSMDIGMKGIHERLCQVEERIRKE